MNGRGRGESDRSQRAGGRVRRAARPRAGSLLAVLTLALLALLGSAAPARAQDPAEAPARTAPARVVVGMYLNRLPTVSLRENRFVADFYLWFRWDDPELDPAATFEVVGGRIERQDVTYDGRPEGRNYVVLRVVASVSIAWDVSRFPLDDHAIEIRLEDAESEATDLVYEPDLENTGTDPGVVVPGWTILRERVEIDPNVYVTNWGRAELAANTESVFSQFRFRIGLVRPGIGYFFKLFTGLFMAVATAFLVFFIRPTETDPRFGLGVAAVFGAVSSLWVTTSSLPETTQITVADRLHIIAFTFILASIAQSTQSLRLYETGRKDESQRLDVRSFWIVAPLYVVLTVLAIVVR